MKLPDDVVRWLEKSFSASDLPAARELLELAIDHAGKPAGARLLRCAAVGSQGDPERLRYLVGLMQIDYRDVIVAGEYEARGKDLVRVRDLNQPIG